MNKFSVTDKLHRHHHHHEQIEAFNYRRFFRSESIDQLSTDDDLLINILNFQSQEINVSRDWFDWRATREKSISGNFYKSFSLEVSAFILWWSVERQGPQESSPSISRRVKAHLCASFGHWRFDFEAAAVFDFRSWTTQLVKLLNSSPARERLGNGFAEEKLILEHIKNNFLKLLPHRWFFSFLASRAALRKYLLNPFC